MRLVRVAARHPAEPVREPRAPLVASGFAHPDILTTLAAPHAGGRVCAGPSAASTGALASFGSLYYPPMPLVTGATAAGFTIVRLLGRGQIGELYLAEHPRLPRQYALKILSADVSADAEYRFRFNQESDRAAALWHPNIVGLHDRGEYEGRLWLLMDYVDGTDAAQLLTDTYPDGMPTDMVIEIVSAIADALDYAHEHGLAHEYVNPSNILLANSESATRRILLAGLGISRRVDETNSLTRANLAIGTASYAAPEQLMDDSIDGRTDQYALASTAFHLLTGSAPFAHMNPAVVISKHLNELPPRPGDVRPELTYLDAPFGRALKKNPSERFRRCRDFVTALESKERLGPYIPATLLPTAQTKNATPTQPALPPLPAAAIPAPPAAEVADAIAPPHVPPEPELDDGPAPPDLLPDPAVGDAATAPHVLPEPAHRDTVTAPHVLPEPEADDAIAFAGDEDDVWSVATDETSKLSRRRRLLPIAGLVLTVLAVALGGILGVMALRSTSESNDTPTNVETPSSPTRVPPARPAPVTAIPPPMVTAPAPAPAIPPPVASPPAATTTPSPSRADTTVPPTTRPPAATTTPSPSPAKTTVSPASPTPPAGLDTRPAVGMPCGPEGSSATSNSGGPVSCVETPGGFAWEPPGG
jgi:serine/threonine protein kinase, bacterial